MDRANNLRYLRTHCVASSMSKLGIRNWMSLEWLTGKTFEVEKQSCGGVARSAA
jgi:hypothetical protein